MSQIAVLNNIGGSGGAVSTLTGDTGGAISPNVGGNINILTGDGLTSTGTPLTNTITLTLDGFTTNTAQTIDAVTADVITISLGAVPATYIFEAKVIGFESTTPASCGYNLICIAKTTGAAAAIVGSQDKYVAESGGLAACDANFVAAGNTVVCQVTGTAGLTVNWKASTTQMGV